MVAIWCKQRFAEPGTGIKDEIHKGWGLCIKDGINEEEELTSICIPFATFVEELICPCSTP